MSSIIFENLTDLDIDTSLVSTIFNDLVKDKDIELVITTNSEIRRLNLSSRGIDKATDVLSFPYEDMPYTPLGSIVISKDFIEDGAKQYRHCINDEFALLFIHGLLHILGYDHEVDNGEHREKEIELITKYKLPKSLIIRNS